MAFNIIVGMYGVIRGLKLCNQDRVDQLNERIYGRNLPSSVPQMQFDPRPVPTKYCNPFPVTAIPSPHPKVPIVVRPTFDTSKVFLPGDSAPWNGFDVNKESQLRNINFALQKCPQAHYVPSTSSDMFPAFSYPTVLSSNAVEPPKLSPVVPGESVFYNDTRQQVKDGK